MIIYDKDKIKVRKATEGDIKTIRNLQLAYENQIEIARLTKMTYKEYLTWHVFNSLDTTYILYIEEEITAILGFAEDSNLFFLATNRLEKNRRRAVKHFKELLETLMTTEGLDMCRVFIDSSYKASIRWATRYGFKMNGIFEINKEITYGAYEYKIQKDNLSL